MRDSKITFRVSDDLLERVDEIEESRSEIMREALRSYLEGGAETRETHDTARKTQAPRDRPTLDDVLHAMVRDAVEEAVEEKLGARPRERENVNVTVNVPDSGSGAGASEPNNEAREKVLEERAEADAPDAPDARRTTESEGKTCHQCGEEVADEHVHCPNCGAKTAQRLFCDCGDEIRSDWSFCPSCGRRTPTSHALSKE